MIYYSKSKEEKSATDMKGEKEGGGFHKTFLSPFIAINFWGEWKER